MPKRNALFIGNSEYQDATLTRLKTPDADDRSLAAALRDPSIGEFDEVTELIDEGEGAVRRAIATFFARRHPDDLMLLYFSGHGVKDDRGRLYLAVKDTSTHQLSATGISSSFVTEQMDECRSRRQILILDCCNSGAFAKGTKGDATALTKDTFAGNGYGRVVLTASDATQYALEGDQVIDKAELSIFTHYLLEGLTNGAASEDEVITLDTLYDYAYGKVVNATPGQTPRKWVYNQQGGLIIAKNPRRRDALPVAIDAELRAKVQHADVARRLEAVADLGEMLDGGDWSRIVAARSVLQRTADGDKSRNVRDAARGALSARAGQLQAVANPAPPTGRTGSAGGATKPPQDTRAKPLTEALSSIPLSKELGETASRVTQQLSQLSLRGAWVFASVIAVAVAGGINGGMFGANLILASGRFVAALVEGGLFGLALYLVMRRFGIAVNPVAWMLAFLAAEAVRWQIPVPGFPYRTTSGGLLLKGVLDGVIVGFAQAWALNLKANVQKLWVAASAAGWTVAMFLWAGIGGAFIQTINRSPMLPSILMGAATGLAVGAATCVMLTSLPREGAPPG
jgi:hypothetical protein